MRAPEANPVPPVICDLSPPSRPNRWLFTVWIGLLAVGALVVFLFDPAAHSFYPVCPLHVVTGLNCPGCGSLRALHRLSHGDVMGAARLNLFLVVSVAVACFLAISRLVHRWSGWPFPRILPESLVWLWLGLMIAFGVLRNLPGFGWLAP